MFIIEPYLSRVLEEYREIEEIQSRINKIYEEAKVKYITLDEDDKDFEKDYMECIESYVK